MLQIFADLAARGITSVGLVLQTDSEGPAGPTGALDSVGMMILVEDLPLGSHALLGGDPSRAIDARTSSSLHKPENNRVVGGVKLYLDGTLGARTACLLHPYSDAPSTLGFFTLDPDVARERMEAAHLAGLQICVNANGDAANALALELFADVLARHPTDGKGPRHSIEHAAVLDDSAAERFADLGIAAVVQPLFIRNESSWIERRIGRERLPRAYPFRSLLDAGVVLAGSSDAPLEEPDVLAGMAAAVHRHGLEPAQGLTIEEAIEMYTVGGAIAQQRDHVTGRIAEGIRADLVILSEDPTTVPDDRIADIEVRRTIVGGRMVHCQGPP
jgi:predicted amidohydrolase YtcJ